MLAAFIFANPVFAQEDENINEKNTVRGIVELAEKEGRSDEEYFFTPIIGLYYTDITGLAQSFFTSSDPDVYVNDNPNVNKTDLGGVFGLLIDGQYQIIATDYWRAGFQTGFVYYSPSKTEFQAQVNTTNGCCIVQNGTLKTSSYEIPLMFTFSRYAESDDWITTFKLGPTLIHNKYELEDFEEVAGVSLTTDNENEIIFGAGFDARYRLEDSDNFLLMGFVVNNIFGNNNNSFSGVDSFGNFSTYIGFSFS